MFTLVVHLTIKEGLESAFREVAAKISKVTNEQDKGCIAYHYLQNTDNPREFVVYEQWEDDASLDAHVEHLQAMFGKPSPGERLPAAIGEYFQSKNSGRYEWFA